MSTVDERREVALDVSSVDQGGMMSEELLTLNFGPHHPATHGVLRLIATLEGEVVRDVKPVIVAVDGGADAILEEGWRPDMIVGDMDSASEASLRCGAELVVHAYPDGRAPGRAALDKLGLARDAALRHAYLGY